jgi:hypothetical protein
MWVYPVGTTDFNFGDTNSYVHFYLNANLKAESSFDAPTSGTMPLLFYSDECEQGPYDFIAHIQHSMGVSLDAPSRLPMKGALDVSAANPDGVAITSGVTASIQVKQPGSAWQTVGSAALTMAPTAVPYQIPASLNGAEMSLRAVVSGPGYATKGSATSKVTVGSKPKVRLSAAKRNVPRLQPAKLNGKATGFATHIRVTIKQRQASGGPWKFEGTTTTAKDGSFHYSEVVHRGDRYYKACVSGKCSPAVFVHVVT